MAYGADTFLVDEDYSPAPGKVWDMVEIDCTLSTVATGTPRKLVPIYDNEGIDVLACECVTAGTANAVVNIGIHTAAAAEGDEDLFVDDQDLAAGAWSRALVRGYANRSGATQYLTFDVNTANDSAGFYRVYYKKFPLAE